MRGREGEFLEERVSVVQCVAFLGETMKTLPHENFPLYGTTGCSKCLCKKRLIHSNYLPNTEMFDTLPPLFELLLLFTALTVIIKNEDLEVDDVNHDIILNSDDA